MDSDIQSKSETAHSVRGEHGHDQDWISCRILAMFSDQDWIWIFIFEKNWIRTGSGIGLISITKFSSD